MAFEGLFLDSAYAIALVSTADQHHGSAAEFAASLKANPTRLVTTRAVLLEIGNALAKPQYRSVAIAMLQGFENDPGMEIIPLSDALYERGFEAVSFPPRQGLEFDGLHLLRRDE